MFMRDLFRMKSESGNGADGAFPTKANGIKLIALDCDGVLFDSREANVQFYSHIMQVIGHAPVRPDQFEYIHMYPVRESLLYLTGGENEDFRRAYRYFETIEFGSFDKHLRREPGLVRFLTLAHVHFKTALATNRTASTLKLLEEFDLLKFFDMVVCASDVERPKPYPDIMTKILGGMEVRAEEVLYVGDSKVDEEFAVATGVRFVGYKNSSLKADLHINHFNELNSLFPEHVVRAVQADPK